MIKIGDQSARRRQHGPAEAAEPVKRRHPMHRLQSCFAAVTGKIAGRTVDRLGRRFGPAFGHHHFACPQPGQGRTQPVGRAFLQLHPPGRNVAGGQADHAAHLADRRQHIGAARFEQRLFGQRSGGDEADNIAGDQCLRSAALLRFLRRFDLLGDRHPAPGLDQPGEIAFGRMGRHPAHRHSVAAAGQRNIEDLRGGLRIVEEQFEEIAHPVEQQAITSFRLERKILLHHRSCRGRSVHGQCLARVSAIREAWHPIYPLSRRRCFR